MCSHHVPKFPNAFPKMFPIAHGFYPMWFAQSSTPMYINYKGKIQGCTFAKFNSHVYKLQRWNSRVHICFYFATWGPKMCFYWGHAQCFKKNAGGPINMAPFKKKRKSCEPTHNLINMNHNLSPIVSPNKGSKILVHLHMFFCKRVLMYCKVPWKSDVGHHLQVWNSMYNFPLCLPAFIKHSTSSCISCL